MRGEGLYLRNHTIEMLTKTDGILCNYIGLNTKEFNDVREECKKLGFNIKIIRRKLIAQKGIGIEGVFEGSTALIINVGSVDCIEERLLKMSEKLEQYFHILQIICVIYKKRLVPISYFDAVIGKTRQNILQNIMRGIIVSSYGLISLNMKIWRFIQVREVNK